MFMIILGDMNNMTTYNLYLNNKFTTTLQANTRIEAIQKAQAFKTNCMQRIHVQKPDFGADQ